MSFQKLRLVIQDNFPPDAPINVNQVYTMLEAEFGPSPIEIDEATAIINCALAVATLLSIAENPYQAVTYSHLVTTLEDGLSVWRAHNLDHPASGILKAAATAFDLWLS